MYENGYGGIFSCFSETEKIIGVNCPFGSELGGKYLTLSMTTNWSSKYSNTFKKTRTFDEFSCDLNFDEFSCFALLFCKLVLS